MPLYHSYTDVRRMLEKAIANPKKREFALGYLEGQGEHFGQGWKISPSRLNEALGRLAAGRESSASPSLQITSADIEKIQAHISNIGNRPSLNPRSVAKPLPKLPPRMQPPTNFRKTA